MSLGSYQYSFAKGYTARLYGGKTPKKPKNIYHCLTFGAKVPQHVLGISGWLTGRTSETHGQNSWTQELFPQ